ncbi:MAG: MerR family DNA-binding transcriptional regulator [Spirochaetaceae bacterium]|nr:MerR family DNA-binding transcriptional regulator [Spirochaetaceae bacterium]
MNPPAGKGAGRLLTIGQAAELLGVHPLTIRNWSEKGTIRCLRTPGGHRRYRLQDLQRAIAAPQDDPATAAAIAELARSAVREALAGPPPDGMRQAGRAALPSGSSVLHGLRAELSGNQRRSMTHLGRELLGLLIRYAVAQADVAAATETPNGEAQREDILPRARQLGASYGRAARRLGLAPADVVATFNFFQETVVQALVECEALDYSRLSRLFGVALLAAVTAAAAPAAAPQPVHVTHT